MKNGICFLGTSPSAPSREQGLEFAPQTPMASRRLATLTLPEPPCYDVEAVREAPEQRNVSWQNTLNRGLFKRLYAIPLGVGFQRRF